MVLPSEEIIERIKSHLGELAAEEAKLSAALAALVSTDQGEGGARRQSRRARRSRAQAAAPTSGRRSRPAKRSAKRAARGANLTAVLSAVSSEPMTAPELAAMTGLTAAAVYQVSRSPKARGSIRVVTVDGKKAFVESGKAGGA